MNYLQGFVVKNVKVKIISFEKAYKGANIRIYVDPKQLFTSINDVLYTIQMSEELYETGWGIPERFYEYTATEENNGSIVLHKKVSDGDITISFQMILPAHILTVKELDAIYPLIK